MYMSALAMLCRIAGVHVNDFGQNWLNGLNWPNVKRFKTKKGTIKMFMIKL